MTRYPRAVRDACLKCIPCNAPVIETIDGQFHCVDCGGSPIRRLSIHGDGGERATGTD